MIKKPTKGEKIVSILATVLLLVIGLANAYHNSGTFTAINILGILSAIVFFIALISTLRILDHETNTMYKSLEISKKRKIYSLIAYSLFIFLSMFVMLKIFNLLIKTWTQLNIPIYAALIAAAATFSYGIRIINSTEKRKKRIEKPSNSDNSRIRYSKKERALYLSSIYIVSFYAVKILLKNIDITYYLLWDILMEAIVLYCLVIIAFYIGIIVKYKHSIFKRKKVLSHYIIVILIFAIMQFICASYATNIKFAVIILIISTLIPVIVSYSISLLKDLNK